MRLKVYKKNTKSDAKMRHKQEAETGIALKVEGEGSGDIESNRQSRNGCINKKYEQKNNDVENGV